MAILTTPHERALSLLFAELEAGAAAQPRAFLGTPGTHAERTNENGTTFWVHRYSDALNRRRETPYIPQEYALWDIKSYTI
jgi:hypothetical protein